MAEASISDEDSIPSIKLFHSTENLEENEELKIFKSTSHDEESLLSSDESNGNNSYKEQKAYTSLNQEADHQIRKISESMDHLSTSSDSDEHFHKKVRVGNHYQARIPKYFGNFNDSVSYSCDEGDDDKLLWDPLGMQPDAVEKFLKKLSSITKLIIPMGKHLRDNEEALYVLQQNNYNVDKTLKTITTSNDSSLFVSANHETMSVWTAEECKNFELGLVRFGKDFYLIQKRRVTTRKIGELVQFYYLWKKTERYDLFAHRLRAGKKKYLINPGISDLMNRYLNGQNQTIESNLGSQDVQFLLTDNKDNTQADDIDY